MNWDQLRTILWLRRRLTMNQWRKGGALGPVIAILMAVGAAVFAVGGFAGGLMGGLWGLRGSGPTAVQTTWAVLTLAFLFFWFIGLLAELQRAEAIDIQRLLHLPVLPGQLFALNYLASHFSPGIVFFVPAMAGLATGLAFSQGAAMLLLLPLALAMVLMVTAWTYCLRGWLGAMMANPRRRRAILMGITFAFVVVFQLPNLYFNVLHRPAKGQRHAMSPSKIESLRAVFHAQKFVPPFWLSTGARGLADGRAAPALLGLAGCLALGGLGLRRAYTVTMRAYRGDTGGRARPRPAVAAAPVNQAGTIRRLFVERRPPFVPEEAAAVALATMQSMFRAPEVKMALAMSVFLPIVIGGSILMRGPAEQLPLDARPFVVTGASMLSIFMMIQFVANVFGYDRSGFRGLVLTPANRRNFLLGKNLAMVPVGLLTGGLFVVATAVWLHLPPAAFLAALLRFATMLLIVLAGGNLLSILLPYRVQAGSLKPTKLPGLTMLVMVLCQLFFPVLMLPVFLPPLLQYFWNAAKLPAFVPIDLGLSALLAAFALFGYGLLLGPMGRLLQRRETRILTAVTADVE